MRRFNVLAMMIAMWLSAVASVAAVDVECHKTLELVFTAGTTPSNPFDTYLLKLEVTDPAGRKFAIDGFYDGDGQGGQTGKVWKARLCPYAVGRWSWRTVPGDAPDSALQGLQGTFDCINGPDVGGIVQNGHHFEFQSGDYVYLVGNFLDFVGGLLSTHVFMSQLTSDAQRNAIITRQENTHTANKINVYFANKGDYGRQSVTPWITSADMTQMHLGRWALYDGYIRSFKDRGMLAEMWFFADDSGFGGLPQADQERLIRYGMARTSAFSHTLYVLALEWQESFAISRVNALGTFAKNHNPWGRLLSVHNHKDWQFAGQAWPTFIATQAGNASTPGGNNGVNALAVLMRNTHSLPHIDEEYGHLDVDGDARLRGNLWANFCGGAAGGGTGGDLKAFQRFLNQSRAPFQRMRADNSLVEGGLTTRFCLTEPGHHYVVYSTTGAFTLTVTGSSLQGRWFDPRNPNASLGNPFAVSSGTSKFTPPNNATLDWVLWVTEQSSLNSGVTNPTRGADLIQVIVPPSSSSNLPPTVILSSPSADTNWQQGTPLDLDVVATDADGAITKVEFFDGSTKLGEDLQTPYTMTWDTATASPGPHILTALATDDGGAATASSAVIVTILSQPNQPQAMLTATPAMVVVGESVLFTSTVTDPDGGMLNLALDVEDDGQADYTTTIASGASATNTHTYTTVGNLTARLTATDPDANVGSAIATVSVVPPLAQVDPRPNPTTGTAPLTVTFSGISAGGVPPIDYAWDFGDGAMDPGPGNDMVHPYAQPGAYVVVLTATDSQGHQATGQTTVTVTEADPNQLVISNLTTASGAAYLVVNQLAVNDLVYIDRSFTYTTIPAAYLGKPYLRTANGDKSRTEDAFLSFSVNQAVTVSVAYDVRGVPPAGTLPTWLSSWTDTGDIIGTTDVNHRIYQRTVAANTPIILGANKASGANGAGSMYTVLLAPTISCIGDVVQDGTRDLSDPVRCIRYLLGLETLTGNELIAADANQDGTVDLSDVIRLIRDLTGVEPLPACQ
ncbi:MAG: PKD domain-containing protein [Candidatus Omnitrophica bacterium]|nr:PKD domain-containing protein [Candidatus Omnitrophota bacterium]